MGIPVEKAKSAAKRTKAAKPGRSVLNMRIEPDLRALIDEAAELTGRSRTGFVLEAARQAAQDALLDSRVVYFNPRAFKAFQKLLDAPPAPNENLRKTMQTPAPWEE